MLNALTYSIFLIPVATLLTTEIADKLLGERLGDLQALEWQTSVHTAEPCLSTLALWCGVSDRQTPTSQRTQAHSALGSPPGPALPSHVAARSSSARGSHAHTCNAQVDPCGLSFQRCPPTSTGAEAPPLLMFK